MFDQQIIAILDNDVNIITHSMAGFPMLTTITLDPRAKSWGEKNWSVIAGMERTIFTENEHTCTG